MAELEQRPTNDCCSKDVQANCCEPSDKAVCCGESAAGGSCGCSAGESARPSASGTPRPPGPPEWQDAKRSCLQGVSSLKLENGDGYSLRS
jgi:hypothetical protein